MADAVEVVSGPKVTVGFERKVALPKQYENASASVFVTGTLDDFSRVDPDQLRAVIKDAFFAGKSAVFEQLGLTFDVTQELVVQERLEAAGLSAVEVTSREEATAVAQTVVQHSTNAIGDAPEDTDDQWRELAAHPERFFDNRETKKGRQPDFKRVNTGDALWLGSKSKPVPSDVDVPPAGSGYANEKKGR